MSARQLFESIRPIHEEARPVVYRDKVVKDGVQMCPHCQEEIHEKGIGYVEGKWVHGACGGEITLRPMSAAERAWLEQFTGKAQP